MTHIHTSNHANKKCTIRDKRKSGMFSSFKDFTIEFEGLYLKFMVPLKVINLRPNINGPLKNEKFMQRDHSKREIYIQTQTGHSRMSNLCQRHKKSLWAQVPANGVVSSSQWVSMPWPRVDHDREMESPPNLV